MKASYWWVIITYIAMQFSVLLLFLIHDLLNVEKPIGVWVNEVVGMWSVFSFSIGLIVILFLLRHDIKNRHHDKNRVSRQSAVGWAITGVFLAFIAQMVAGLIEMHLLNIEPGSENTKDLVNIAKATPIFILVGALLAPILEEIIFRQIIFGSIFKKTNNFLLAAIISSLIFAVIHRDFDHLLIYTAMGLTFAFLYVKTKRILVPIIAHATMNTIVFVLHTFVDIEDLESYREQLEQTGAIFIGGIF